MAGLFVNERAETSLAGLYAAGDAAAIPFQYLTGAFVMGEVAAEQAAERARGCAAGVVDEQEIAAASEAIAEGMRPRPSGEVFIHEFEYKVRRLINDYVTPPKNEWKLQNAIRWMRRLREELKSIVRADDAHDLSRRFEVGCILDCAELSATAAAVRKESRWGPKHYRTDYPDRDDAHWLKHVALERSTDDSIAVTLAPVSWKGGESATENRSG